MSTKYKGRKDEIDLGNGHSYAYITGSPSHFPTDDDRLTDWMGSGLVLVGIIESHPGGSKGDYCADYVPFMNGTNDRHGGTPRPLWSVNSLEPLDLEPYIDCAYCGTAGKIHDGIWVPR